MRGLSKPVDLDDFAPSLNRGLPGNFAALFPGQFRGSCAAASGADLRDGRDVRIFFGSHCASCVTLSIVNTIMLSANE
jgi:hypothetical protein